jgi:hypothetical protein
MGRIVFPGLGPGRWVYKGPMGRLTFASSQAPGSEMFETLQGSSTSSVKVSRHPYMKGYSLQ